MKKGLLKVGLGLGLVMSSAVFIISGKGIESNAAHKSWTVFKSPGYSGGGVTSVTNYTYGGPWYYKLSTLDTGNATWEMTELYGMGGSGNKACTVHCGSATSIKRNKKGSTTFSTRPKSASQSQLTHVITVTCDATASSSVTATGTVGF